MATIFATKSNIVSTEAGDTIHFEFESYQVKTNVEVEFKGETGTVEVPAYGLRITRFCVTSRGIMIREEFDFGAVAVRSNQVGGIIGDIQRNRSHQSLDEVILYVEKEMEGHFAYDLNRDAVRIFRKKHNNLKFMPQSRPTVLATNNEGGFGN